MLCEYCNKEHDGSYGSGRFCSQTCSRKYSNTFVTEKGRQNQINTLNKYRDKSVDTRKKSLPKTIKSNKIHKSTFNDIKKKNGESINTKRLGNIGEISTIKKFVEHEIPVYLPFGDNEDADLIAEFDGKLQKIQVKSSSRNNGDTTVFTTKHRDSKTHNPSAPYDNIDYFSLYDYTNDEVYLIKNTHKKSKTIRHVQALNNNNNEILYADDIKIDKVLNDINNKYIIDVQFVELNDDTNNGED